MHPRSGSLRRILPSFLWNDGSVQRSCEKQNSGTLRISIKGLPTSRALLYAVRGRRYGGSVVPVMVT